MRMFYHDPVTKELIAFFITVALGAISYLAATLIARWISPIPRHLYWGRLVLLPVCILFIAFLFQPYTVVVFSGSSKRYFEYMMNLKGLGISYGAQTFWMWFILALLKWPKRRHQNTAKPGAAPNAGQAESIKTS
jgi:hypothetical protein